MTDTPRKESPPSDLGGEPIPHPSTPLYYLREAITLAREVRLETRARAAQLRATALKSALAGGLLALGAQSAVACIILLFALARSTPSQASHGPLTAATWAAATLGVLLTLTSLGVLRAQWSPRGALRTPPEAFKPKAIGREFGSLEHEVRSIRRAAERFDSSSFLPTLVWVAGVTYLVAREWGESHPSAHGQSNSA
jgi:hypothetical protein